MQALPELESERSAKSGRVRRSIRPQPFFLPHHFEACSTVCSEIYAAKEKADRQFPQADRLSRFADGYSVVAESG
jgi:hypothetical protein